MSVMLDTPASFASPRLISVQLSHAKMKDFVKMKIMVINSVVNVLLVTMVPLVRYCSFIMNKS